MRSPILTGILIFLLLCVSGFLSGCITKEDIDRFVEENFARSAVGSENAPVARDFEEIKNSGVLRMITTYNSSTYFLHQGFEAGFEYELLQAFAREHGLVLEVVFMGADENPHHLLNSGSGDVIAANYTVTPQRRRAVQFTRPYKLANKIIVYSDSLETKPGSIGELSESGVPITVRRNSSAYMYLDELRSQGYELDIEIVPEDVDTKSQLVQVANGNIMATVLNDHTYRVAGSYIPGLQAGPVIARNDTIAWGIRKNAPGLEEEMNRFLQKHFRFANDREEPRRSILLNMLRQRYYNASPQIEDYYNPERHYSSIELLPSYDGLIKSVADSLDLDWLMLTAIIVQESGFRSDAKSLSGAVGLMQILPRFSVTEYQSLYDPGINITEGAGILKKHLDHYAYLDSLNQWSFALATYNVGIGHMVDARRLVMDQNKNPNEWANVEDALLKLMQRRYYENARFGYCRGIETVQYVKQILNRYQAYTRVASITGEEISGNAPPGEIVR